MDRPLNGIHRICPAAFCSRDFFLLHDNAPAHKAASVCQFLTKKKKVTTFISPLCSQDLSPPDYFMFPELKMKLKGLQFADVAEIQEAVTHELKRALKRNFRQLNTLSLSLSQTLYCVVEGLTNQMHN
jgi:hypothetical protein